VNERLPPTARCSTHTTVAAPPALSLLVAPALQSPCPPHQQQMGRDRATAATGGKLRDELKDALAGEEDTALHINKDFAKRFQVRFPAAAAP
jgi:hypothetical protein